MGFNKQEFKKKHFENDPIKFTYFFRHGFNGQTKVLETLPLLEFEKGVINHIHGNRFSVINKSRQMHLSSILAAYVTWNLIFKENFKILIIAPNTERAVHFNQIVLNNINNIPPEIFNQKEIVVNNKKLLTLKNGSSIQAIPASLSTEIGSSPDMIIFDECAFTNYLTEMYVSMSMQLPEHGKLILASSPNCEGDFFERTCTFSKRGASSFALLELHWSINPYYNRGLKKLKKLESMGDFSYTSPWYENQIENYYGNLETFNAELNLQFRRAPQKKTETISLRLEQAMIQELEDKVIREGHKNMSEYIRNLIKADLEK